MNVDIWSDLACPWCYIGTQRFERALAAFEDRDQVKVIWHSFQLDPELPEQFDGSEADYLSQTKGMDRASVDAMMQQVAATAQADGLLIDFDTVKVANSRLAHHLVHLAQLRGVADAVNRDLFEAHFGNGENIADLAVLTRIGLAHGLDADDITEALGSPAYDTAMKSDAAQAQGIGISGVPFFIVDGKYGISGAQPEETFTKAFALAGDDAASGEGGGCCGGGCCS